MPAAHCMNDFNDTDNERTMPDNTNKVPENVLGAWYVDNELCTPCRVCLDEAPDLLKWNDDETKVYFFKQPESPEELGQAQASLEICPQAAIGNDGE
jgi:ferredoxin